MDERRPLIDTLPRFTCPACGSVQRSPRAVPPAWLRCSACRARFIANASAARTWLLLYIVGGIVLLGLALGITVWSVTETEKKGGVYFVFYGGIAVGVFMIIRGSLGICWLRAATQASAAPRGQTMVALPPPFLGARQGDLAEVQRAVESGFNVNSKSVESIACLQYASQRGHLDIVSYLLSHGADPNMRGSKSCPLLEASANGHLEIVQALIGAGADEHASTRSGDKKGNPVQLTALVLACVRGHADVARFLLSRGHDPNEKPLGCNPPLLCAAKSGFLDVIQVLHAAGANMNIQNSSRQTALHIAVEHNRPEAVRLLLSLGVDASIPNAQGITALVLASGQNKSNLVKIFRQFGQQVLEGKQPPPYAGGAAGGAAAGGAGAAGAAGASAGASAAAALGSTPVSPSYATGFGTPSTRSGSQPFVVAVPSSPMFVSVNASEHEAADPRHYNPHHEGEDEVPPYVP